MYYRKETKQLEYGPPLETFEKFSTDLNGFLLESADIAPIYGRMSLMSIDPPLEVIGQDDHFQIIARNKHGQALLRLLAPEQFDFCDKVEISNDKISGKVIREMELLDESHRQRQSNIASVIRVLLKQFSTTDPYLGLYGAFSYDFVRLFEDLPQKHDVTNIPDFHLYLPDLIYVFNHLKETAELYYYNFSNTTLDQRLAELPQTNQATTFSVRNLQSSIQQNEFENQVLAAKQYMKKGDIFEVVLSRQFTADFEGSALGVYKRYRETNPSPYMFYFQFGQEQPRTLLGASPEMFIRVENGTVMARPISGTAKRSAEPLEDYQNMMSLLNSPKEKSELDMLIDLARNDLARVCKPGIAISDYRYVEKYSKVMHTIAQVQGELDDEHFTAFDAFIACLNAGTLTGAPKIRAMEIIEEMEPQRRGYYGGNVGYLTFNNELNTGIIIRSAIIENGQFTTQAGATLLYDSQPTAEFDETNNKAAAILATLK